MLVVHFSVLWDLNGTEGKKQKQNGFINFESCRKRQGSLELGVFICETLISCFVETFLPVSTILNR